MIKIEENILKMWWNCIHATYLWNRWVHGSFLAVSIFSQQMAQLSEFSASSSAEAIG